MDDELRRIERLLREAGQARRNYARGVMLPTPTWIEECGKFLHALYPDLAGQPLFDLIDMAITYRRDPEGWA